MTATAPDTTVTFAFVHDDSPAYSWTHSKEQLLGHDLTGSQRVAAGGYIAMTCGTGGLIEARNGVVRAFLESDCEWLFWIDTDMGFAPDTVDRLVAPADPVDRPIVAGLCFLSREDPVGDGMGGRRSSPRPTIFDWVDVGNGRHGFTSRLVYPVNALTRCSATGSACILIHRTVFEKIEAEYGATWYDRIPNPELGHLISEDLSFCVRATGVGFPIHVHTGVRTTHLKQRYLCEADYWEWLDAPPATERTAVVIPVLSRPDNVAPLMESLRASTGLATAYFVVDAADTAERAAVLAAGAKELAYDAERAGTFAQKVNHAYDHTTEPWLFLCGDDVRFKAGWLDHAQMMAHAYNLDVIGTNDLANPRVMAGEHATHMLIRRSYIAEHGASWDGPGVVCHEGYAHWFVDDEIVTVAQQRGVWGMALGSRVEHLHPIFGTAPDDAVYQLGQQHAQADSARFARRVKEHS